VCSCPFVPFSFLLSRMLYELLEELRVVYIRVIPCCQILLLTKPNKN